MVGILILLQLFEALRHYEADLGFLLNVRRQIGVFDQVGDYQVLETLVVVLSLEINEPYLIVHELAMELRVSQYYLSNYLTSSSNFIF